MVPRVMFLHPAVDDTGASGTARQAQLQETLRRTYGQRAFQEGPAWPSLIHRGREAWITAEYGSQRRARKVEGETVMEDFVRDRRFNADHKSGWEVRRGDYDAPGGGRGDDAMPRHRRNKAVRLDQGVAASRLLQVVR